MLFYVFVHTHMHTIKYTVKNKSIKNNLTPMIVRPSPHYFLVLLQDETHNHLLGKSLLNTDLRTSMCTHHDT